MRRRRRQDRLSAVALPGRTELENVELEPAAGAGDAGRAEADKITAEQGADAKRRQENCARARENMALLDYGGRVARVNEKGERYFLEDAQVAQEKAKAQASVNEWCK